MSQEFEAPSGGRQFGVGRVLAVSLAIFGRNFLSFALISIIFSLPSLAIEWLLNPAFNGAPQTDQGDLLYNAVSFVADMICSGIVTGTLVYGSFQDLRGQRAGLGECISKGLATLPKVIVAAIIFGIMVGVGYALLIIPGIILTLMYWVYAPVLVVERPGIWASFTRSAALTKDNRSALFGILLVIGLGALAIGAVGGAVLGAVGGTAVIIGVFVIGALVGGFMAVASTVSYYSLRADKEGVEVEDIAKLFD